MGATLAEHVSRSERPFRVGLRRPSEAGRMTAVLAFSAIEDQRSEPPMWVVRRPSPDRATGTWMRRFRAFPGRRWNRGFDPQVTTVPEARAVGALLHGRLYVLVEAEQVSRVVPILQRDEPLIVPAVGPGNPAGLLSVQMVDVNLTAGKRLNRIPVIPRPLNVSRRLGR